MSEIDNQSNPSEPSYSSDPSTPAPGHRCWLFRGRRENKPCLRLFQQNAQFSLKLFL
jgi:hypothetical protein